MKKLLLLLCFPLFVASCSSGQNVAQQTNSVARQNAIMRVSEPNNERQRQQLAASYMELDGWRPVNLGNVQHVKLNHLGGDVVYVEFGPNVRGGNGWYQLGFMASAYNMPKVSLGHFTSQGLLVIGNGGQELFLQRCHQCDNGTAMSGLGMVSR